MSRRSGGVYLIDDNFKTFIILSYFEDLCVESFDSGSRQHQLKLFQSARDAKKQDQWQSLQSVFIADDEFGNNVDGEGFCILERNDDSEI